MAIAMQSSVFEPRMPQKLEETGLTNPILDDLLLKRLFLGGPQTSGSLADKLAIPFLLVLANLNELRQLHMVHISGSQGYGERGYVFLLTEDGDGRAKAAFDRNMYDGPAPVPLEEYVQAVASQSVRDVTN